MESIINKMEAINPKDLSRLDPDTISYVTLKNGNIIVLDTSVKEKKNENDKIKSLKISEKMIISYNKFNKEKLNNINKIHKINDFNIVSKIIQNISFSFFGNSQNNVINLLIKDKDKYFSSRNTIEKDFQNKIINISNAHKNTNNLEFIKYSNNYISPYSESQINLNLNKLEENKESNSINKKLRSKNYEERMEKIFDDINKPQVKAVISLDIASEIPYNISGTQRQFNKLITQLRRKKRRNEKLPGDENYKKYYELYKNPNNKIYNDTFNYFDNRIKYYEENVKNDLDINKEKDIFNTNIFNKNTILDNIFYNYMKNSENIINKNYNIKEKNDYFKNNIFSYLFPDKKRSLSYKEAFRDKVNKKVTKINSTIICPSNNY